jgi:hypothetical protein
MSAFFLSGGFFAAPHMVADGEFARPPRYVNYLQQKGSHEATQLQLLLIRMIDRSSCSDAWL